MRISSGKVSDWKRVLCSAGILPAYLHCAFVSRNCRRDAGARRCRKSECKSW